MATRYVNTDSTAGGDGTTNGTSGSTRAYASLSEWEAARQADLTATETELCYCDGSAADTTKVVFDGWTVDSTHYIDIRANTSSKASTAWSTSKYRFAPVLVGTEISFDTYGATSGLRYIRISGLQFEMTVASINTAARTPRLIRLSPTASTIGADVRLSSCYIRVIGAAPFNPMTGAATAVFMNPDTFNPSVAPNIYIFNNIVEWAATGTWSTDSLRRGIHSEHRRHNVYGYNNTVIGFGWGFDGATSGGSNDHIHYLKNNLFSGNAVDTDGTHSNTECDYNATNNADLGYTAGSNDRVSQTFTFVGSGDYAITSGDAGAKDFGVSDPGSGLFSDDIAGTTRSGSWDIGAFEVVAAGGTTYTKDMTDACAVSDGQFLGRERGRHFSEAALAVGDGQFISRERGRLMPDVTVTVVDAQRLSRERGRVMGDALTVADQQALFRLRQRTHDDPVTVTDQTLVTRYFYRVLSDFITLFDTFSKLLAGEGVIYTITLSDAVTVADELLAHRLRSRQLSDVVTLADGTVLTRERLRHLSESLAITDSQLHFLLRTVIASEQVAVTDESLYFRFRARDLVDAISVFDSFALSITGVVPPITVEVRVRLGFTSGPQLGQHDPIRLGADAPPKLGGYN